MLRIFAAALVALPVALAAQAPSPPSAADPAQRAAGGSRVAPTVAAARTTVAVQVDGRLDDAAWAAATPVSAFTQYDPEEGAPVSERTEARVLYDGDALYVGVRLYDRQAPATRLGRRDMDLGDSDWVGLVLDSYHDHRTAFSFDINPSGVRRDAAKTDDGDDMSWDAVWEGAAALDGEGWTAEYRIPFSQLRFNAADEQTWGIQVERIIGRRKEYSVLSFVPKRERGGIATYAHLTGLREVGTGKRLEVLPYTVARAEHVDRGLNPFRAEDERSASVGVDVKYRLTSDLTLDATVNPDFGQVEVDPATVNLSAFETFYEEKRPFFVEGSEIFRFGNGMTPTGGGAFYSRRIGGRASPVLPPSDSADIPGTTRILGAAKLSGKTAGGWSLGALSALTRRESARFRLDGEDGEVDVEPTTHYFVGRARRELAEGRTAFGALVTAANRRLDDDGVAAMLRSAAYTAGVDFRHEFADRTWMLGGFLTGSRIEGSADAIARAQRASHRYFQRPDAGHLELDPAATSLSGLAGNLLLRKQAGQHWTGNAYVSLITPGYETNDVGYQTRGDRLDASATATYRQRQPGAFLRSFLVETSARVEHNLDGKMVYNSLFLGSNWQHLSYWSVQANLGATGRTFDDRLTRGGPIARRPANVRGYLSVSSDPRRDVVGFADAYRLDDDEGGGNTTLSGSVELKVSPRWNLSVGPRWERLNTAAQYVGVQDDAAATATFGRRYVFAPLEQTTVSLDTRLNYTFSPALTVELFAQPFVSSADYGGRMSLRAAGTFDFDPYEGEVSRSDFNYRSLRGNAVMRWEWRPGSTLYLAWQQNREDSEGVGDFRLGRDRRALFGATPDNVFVVKMSYWLNP
jgi:hypothetical protein